MTRLGTIGRTGAMALLASAVAFSGCGGGSEESAPAQTARAPANPAGAAVFKQFCATCHGETGKGDGPGAVALTVKPRDLTSEAYKFVDIAGSGSEVEALVRYIEAGKIESGMPPWKGVLSDQQLHDVAAHVLSLRPKPNFVEEQPAPAGEGASEGSGGG